MPNLNRFKDSIAKIGEHYSEFLVIVKAEDGVLIYRHTDKTWGIGAASRYMGIMMEEERVRTEEGMCQSEPDDPDVEAPA